MHLTQILGEQLLRIYELSKVPSNVDKRICPHISGYAISWPWPSTTKSNLESRVLTTATGEPFDLIGLLYKQTTANGKSIYDSATINQKQNSKAGREEAFRPIKWTSSVSVTSPPLMVINPYFQSIIDSQTKVFILAELRLNDRPRGCRKWCHQHALIKPISHSSFV